MIAEMKTYNLGSGNLEKTIDTIVEVTQANATQMCKFAEQFRGEDARKTAFNIWHYIKNNILYVRDIPGTEQIRTPQRTLADKKGDCEDYSILAATLLHCLGYTPIYHVVGFGHGYQHIFVVVDGVVLDGVMNTFGQYPEGIVRTKIVYPFENKSENPEKINITVLAGEDLYKQAQEDIQPFIYGIDTEGNALVDEDALPEVEDYLDYVENSINGLGSPDELGRLRFRLFKKRHKRSGRAKKSHKVGRFLRKVWHGVKKGTLAVPRNAFLLLVKENVLRLGSKLYLGRLSESQAKKINLDMNIWRKAHDAYDKIVRLWQKLEGKRSSLDKAIDHGIKFLKKRNVISGLGEPSTIAAAIASATPILAKITQWLKGINFKDLFKNVSPKVKEAAKKIWEKTKDYAEEHVTDFLPHKTHNNLPEPYTAKPKTTGTAKKSSSDWVIPALALTAAAFIL